MKTLKLLFAAAILSLTTIACSSDDNKNNETTNSLIGKWTYEKEEALDANGKVVSTYIPEQLEFCEKDFLEFIADGTYIDTYFDYYDNKCDSRVSNGIWSLKDNLLTVDNKSTLTIEFLEDTFAIERPLSREEYEYGDYKLNVIKVRNIYKRK